jgi:hypothetical protein
MPSRDDIRAVREVLYDRDFRNRLKTELNSIVLLMNLDPGEAIPSDDPRVEPGAGPLWFVPATGALDPAVAEAADRCDRIAEILMKARRQVGDLEIDGGDKTHLREALNQQAKSWRVRGRLWRDPGAPDAEAGADEIFDHERKAVQSLKKASDYLKGDAFG